MASEQENIEEQILYSVGKWLEKDVKPHVRHFDQNDIYPTKMMEQMKDMGLFGATISAEYGGLGLSTVTYARLVARVSEVWMSLTGIFNTHLMMARIVELFGTQEQKERFLPRFASGELRGGLALTEPDAGSDLQGIRTHAKKQGDHYIINGAKTWITNAQQGQALALLVKTDSKASPPRKGISIFIIEKGAGMKVEKLDKLGYRGVDTASLTFEDYRVPAKNLVGDIEGKGFYQVVSALELGRINIAARGVGIAKAALDESVQYVQIRKTFGKLIGEHQAIQLKLADMVTRYESARLLTENAAKSYDAGQRADMEAGIAKYAASEAAFENASQAMRIHGGYGYSREFNLERYYRDAPLLCIGEGTNEIQRIIIAKRLIERNKI